MGNPVSYQIIPYAGGTHPAATGAKFAPDEWIYHRLSFMDKQLWVTRYHPTERYPEGKYPNRSAHDTGLGQYAKDDESLTNHDDVVDHHRHHPRGARRRVADHADRVGARAAQAVELL